MNKILANQIKTDCEEFGKDIELGVYRNDLDGCSKESDRILKKFHYWINETDYEDLELTNERENPDIKVGVNN